MIDKLNLTRAEIKKIKARRAGRPGHSTDRDRQILKYLWRWKVASTASVHEAINKISSQYSTYKILDKLERAGFITSQFDWEYEFYVWFLTSKGYAVIKKNFEELVEEGFLSENHNHDRLVQALHFGEWVSFQSSHVLFWTEQEMRRFDISAYPDWVPKSKEHRPDGYTRIIGDKNQWTLAFEVELSTKRISKYESAMQFYKHARQINRVYWLVADNHTKEQILKAKACVNDESFTRTERHSTTILRNNIIYLCDESKNLKKVSGFFRLERLRDNKTTTTQQSFKGGLTCRSVKK